MKKLFTILSLLICANSFATNYYFSYISGDDARTPLQASNKSTPWRTVAKLNTYFASLLPGDSVLFKRGETWPGTGIVIKKSGNPTLPIVIGAYDVGAKPIISGLITLGSWSSVGTNLWESQTTFTNSSDLNIVSQNLHPIAMGRFPNTTDTIGGYITYQTRVTDTSITAAGLPLSSVRNWTNAEMVLRGKRWKLDRVPITGHSGHTIYYKSSFGQTPIPYFGFWIQDDIRTLDRNLEWFYNKTSHKLTVYSIGAPSGIQVSNTSKLITGSGYNNIVIDNLQFVGANISGMDISGSNITIRNCVTNLSGQNGLVISGSSNKVIYDSVLNSLSYGLKASGCTSGTFTNNVIMNSGRLAGMGETDSSPYKGLEIQGGHDNLMEYNEIDSSGYVGIMITGGNNQLTKHNLVNGFGFAKDDGGGIYTRGSVTSSVTYTGWVIDSNIVVNGYGAPFGTDKLVNASPGIYFDDNSANGRANSNTVAFCSRGFLLHNAVNTDIHNNIAFANRQQLYTQRDGIGIALKDNRVTNNILFSRDNSNIVEKNHLSMDFLNVSNSTDINSIGIIDSNYVSKPLNVNNPIHTAFSPYYYTLAAWKSSHSMYDQHSNTAPVTYASTSVQDTSLLFLFNASKIAKVFRLNGKNYKGFKNTIYHGDTIKIQPYQSAILFRDTGLVRGGYVPPAQSPVVAFTAPANNSVFTAPASIFIAADASDPDGTVSKVEFYNGTTLLQTEVNAPYEFTWTNVPAGTYSLVAKATDNSGRVTTSASISITVNAKANVAPTVSLTGPANNATFTAPGTVNLTATASDADGTIASIKFYAGNTLLNTDLTTPYSYSWASVPAGTYSITAVATDNQGATAVSNASAIVVGTVGYPNITLTSPAINVPYYAPATITITATASDPDGTIASVKFYNNTTLLHTETNAPYTWDWTNVPVGNYLINAIATDNTNHSTTSNAIPVTVSNPAVNKVPVVELTGPADGATYATPATITITATASDTDGTINNVGFYNGSTLLGSDNSSPYSYTWTGAAAGTYNISAKAIDNSGATTSSNSVNVTVYTPNIAPRIDITSPTVDAIYTDPASVTVSATAVDEDGSVSVVKFYNADSLIYTDSVAPYTFVWSSVMAGSYTLTATATDNSGSVTASSVVPFTVNAAVPNTLPTVSLTAPANGASYTAPATVTLSATASDPDGTITQVAFYAGTNLLGSITTAPYTITIPDFSAGTYDLVAEATDDRGGVSTTAATPVTITVNAPTTNIPPTIQMTSPGNNATYYKWATIFISADVAAFNGNSINRVEFYNGTTLLSKDYTAPYSYTWTGVNQGSYVITAKVIDSKGLTATTPEINVSVEHKNRNVIKVQSSLKAVVQ